MDISEMAFNFASEVVKQILTLSLAIIGVTITFMKDVVGVRTRLQRSLPVAWCFYFLAVVCGLLTMMAMTGSLDMATRTAAEAHKAALAAGLEPRDPVPPVLGDSASTYAMLMQLFFALGTLAVLVYGFDAYRAMTRRRQAGPETVAVPSIYPQRPGTADPPVATHARN